MENVFIEKEGDRFLQFLVRYRYGEAHSIMNSHRFKNYFHFFIIRVHYFV